MKWLIRCQLLWLFLLLSACGGKKAYLVELNYMPQVPPRVGMSEAAVALAPFIDLRTNKEDVGIRTKLDGGVDRYITSPGSVREGVEKAVERFLRSNRYRILGTVGWDLRPESLSGVSADLVVGGEIYRFWGQADSMVGRTVIKTELEMAIYVGKPRERRVHQQKMELSREVTQLRFSPEKMEEMLNESLSEVIESAFAKLLK